MKKLTVGGDGPVKPPAPLKAPETKKPKKK